MNRATRVVALEGVLTTDGRMLLPNSLRWPADGVPVIHELGAIGRARTFQRDREGQISCNVTVADVGVDAETICLTPQIGSMQVTDDGEYLVVEEATVLSLHAVESGRSAWSVLNPQES